MQVEEVQGGAIPYPLCPGEVVQNAPASQDWVSL